MSRSPIARLAGSMLLVAALMAGSPAARAAEATVNLDIPGGRWKTVRLKSLPRGASIALEIIASGRIRAIVVDSTELKRFPQTRALFEATVENKMGFSVVIPRSDDYYVVLDNRAGEDARKVTLRVRAEPPAAGQRRQPPEKVDKM